MPRHYLHDPWEHPFLEWVFWGLMGGAISVLVLGMFLHLPWLVAFGVIAVGIGVWAGFLEPHRITVATYREPLVTEPSVWLRVVFLSDLHGGFQKRTAFYDRVAARVTSLAPDVLLLGGDLVDVEASGIRELESITRISATMGRYFLLGNHDYRDAPEEIVRYLETQGLQRLTHPLRLERQGKRLELVALQDPIMSIPGVIPPRDPGVPRLLVVHEPDNLLDVETGDADLMVMGHTHGGQVRIPGFGAVHIPQILPRTFDRGRHAWKGIPLVIGQGLGESGSRARFLCPPQIVVFEIGI